MIRITITAAYPAIRSTIHEDAPPRPVQRQRGQSLIQVEAAVLDPLRAMRQARYVPLHWFSGGTVERLAATTRRLC
jgi:hypothetical protein